MRKLALILITLLVVSCSSENKQEKVIRELAKKDIIEKLKLPEGTKFINDNIELTETGKASMEASYIVKITIISQDRDGNKIEKTHTMKYENTGKDALKPENYKLISFE